MAWAEKRATGWRGRYRDSAGQVQSVVQPDGSLFGRKRDAVEAADEQAVAARRRAAVAKGRVSARTSWGEWWDATAPVRPHSDTDVIERSLVERHLRPKWGDTPLVEITHGLVQQWISDDLKVRPGMAPAHVRRIYAVLQGSLSRAVVAEVLGASPCTAIALPKIPKRPKPYLEADSGIDFGVYADAIGFQLETGIRPGELCGLHANRLDLTRGVMSVVEVTVQRQHAIRPWPKDIDVRYVPLTTKAVEIARRALAGRDLSGGCGLPHTDGSRCRSALVFMPRGAPMWPQTVSRSMRRAADRAGTERRSMYAVRRGFATRAAAGGLDAFALAQIMGHSDLEETADYVQMTEQTMARTRAALGDRKPLREVGEQRGADRGAELDREAPSGTVIEGGESAG